MTLAYEDTLMSANVPLSVGLQIAGMLVGKTERTVRRWHDSGSIVSAKDHATGRVMIPMDEITPHIPIPWDGDKSMIAVRADQGDAEAMNVVALYFMNEGQYELAFPWFKLAAEKGHPDAQHWLSKCYFKGWGTDKNQALGLRWLGEAANNGHAIAQYQIKRINIL